MIWFPFQSIMLHTSDYIKSPSDHLQSLLKLFSMFKIMIFYDEKIGHKYFPEYVRIMCVYCGKVIGFLLDNQTIENFVNTFVTNILFQNVGLSWVIQSNQKLNSDFHQHCPYWMMNGPCYNTAIFSRFHCSLFNDFFQLPDVIDII